MDVRQYMIELGQQARAASREMARASTAQKNQALLAAAQALREARDEVLAANRLDLENGRNNGLDAAMLDRLELTPSRFNAMIEGLEQVAALPDPIGEITGLSYRPTGIQVGRMRVPLGVIGIIYESRPNVTIDAASLCLKSGNATILRGGSEAVNANQAIARCIQAGLRAANLPEAAVQVVKTTDREAVGMLISMPEYVDVIVPRGGKGLIDIKVTDRNGPVVASFTATTADQLMLVTDQAKLIRIGLDSLRVIGRSTAGVKLFDVAEGEHVVSAVRLDEQEAPENEAEEAIVEEMLGRGSEETAPRTDQARDDIEDDGDGA